MMQTCALTGKPFEITPEDLAFYEKMGVPPPTLCPEERQRRRLAFRNERKLHHRECSATGKKIISIYSADQPFPVYENSAWWADNWDARDYGRDFDFGKRFFVQFQELLSVVPKMARIQQGENENSTYCNTASWNKNSYLLSTANGNEDCCYGADVNQCKSSVDNFMLVGSELCYEVVNGAKLYNCYFCEDCENSSDLWFCKNCIGCHNCFGCVNLRNKKYHFFNTPCTKEEYIQKIKNLGISDCQKLEHIRKNFFSEWLHKFPVKYAHTLQSENSTGDYLYFSKNAQECFDTNYCEDIKFCNSVTNIKTAYDVSYYGARETNELLYECEGVGHGVFDVKFSKLVWGGSAHIEYCYECFHCQHCFGCTGLKNSEYCILNKQYSKEEYFEMKGKIIEHMGRDAINRVSTKGAEWGEFFPIWLSPFGYNETVAQEYFPMTKEEIVERNAKFVEALHATPLQKWKWKDEILSATYDGPQIKIPSTISETPDSICDQILECEQCAKNYRIVKPELKFYRSMNLPIPHKCPNCRHLNRMRLRNPRKLWTRKCDNPNCKNALQCASPYAPDRPEKVLCEECYLDMVE
ncbi:MAG: hypothetical protein WCJ84_04880 [Candidatus Peregrinibacteria bacterium]